MARADRNHYLKTSIMTAIITYKMAHDGNSPTIRHLAEQVKISSSQIHGHLQDLCEMGLIRMPEGRAAAIEVAGGEWSMNWAFTDSWVRLSELGTTSNGKPK